MAVYTDVSDEDSVRALFEAVGPELHVLVNCAGVLASTDRTPDIALEDWERAFAVNARGTFLCCKHALPRMRRGAAIVNVASVTGVVGVPGRAAYGASKGAVIAFTRALAVDHVGDPVAGTVGDVPVEQPRRDVVTSHRSPLTLGRTRSRSASRGSLPTGARPSSPSSPAR